MYMMLDVKYNSQATPFSIKYCFSSDKDVLLFKVVAGFFCVFFSDFNYKRGFLVDFCKAPITNTFLKNVFNISKSAIHVTVLSIMYKVMT